MTKEEFEVLQLDLQQSGKSVKDYLQEAGVNYSTYNYWRKKLLVKDDPKPELAPISFTQSAAPMFTGAVPSGATLIFPTDDKGKVMESYERYLGFTASHLPTYKEFLLNMDGKLQDEEFLTDTFLFTSR